MRKEICLSRVMRSPTASQALCGYTSSGEYITTEPLFAVADGLYSGLSGTFYFVESWAPDGHGYQDKK